MGAPAPPLPAAQGGLRSAAPRAYTPRHLAEQILTTRSAVEGERKQVTVLFCDLVRSTGLAERLGPEGMHALLNRLFEVALSEVHRYEGTVNQFLGDGFMALFGAPLAHEDHARRGVLAALGILRRLKEELALAPAVDVRMGLNTGVVVVGGIGDNLRMDYTAVGDTTIVASRLERLAAPGTILMSEATARLVAGYARVEALGPVPVRGRSGPVTAYKVLGTGPRRSPLEGVGPRLLSRFVGRQRQVAHLRDLLRRAAAGEGQVAGIAAEPGMGKSRLVYEFRRGLKGARVTYLEGRCLSYGGAVPYLPILDVLRHNCGLVESDGGEAVLEKVRHGLREVGMEPADWAPCLLLLLGVKEGTKPLAALTPEATKARTFETLRQMALRGSQRRPIIFVIEDLHWIDETSEEYLASLVESVARAPILLLCTYRPGYRPPWIAHSYATQISLPRLDPRDSLGVVQSVLQTEQVPGPLAEVILAKAEGNPFFLEELARAVAEHDDFRAELAVPDTVQGVLMARVDRLPEAARRLLQTAAVLGREFSRPLLEAVWDEPGAVDPHLAELKRLEFLYEQSGTAEPVYVFKHALTQDVAYDSLLVSRRQALHTAAGRALEALYAGRLEDVYDRLAHHYSKTGEAAKAVEYLIGLADKAAGVYANADAARALEEALVHAERLPDAEGGRRGLEIVLRLAHSLYFLRRIPDTLDLLLRQRQRLEQLQDAAVAGPYCFWLSHTYSYLSQYERATEAARRAIAEAERCGDESTLGKAHYVLARIGFGACRFQEGVEAGRRAVALLERAQEWLWLGQSYWAMGLNYTLMGEFDAVLAVQRAAREVGEAHGDPRIQTYADWAMGWIYAARGDAALGIEACQKSLDASRNSFNTSAALGWLGHAYLEHGDPARAIALLERGTEQLREAGYKAVTSWFLAWLGDAYCAAGQLERAEEVAVEGHTTATEGGAGWGAAANQRVRGRVAWARGALAEAQPHLHQALETFTALGARFEAGRTHLDLARLAHARGERVPVATHLRQAQALFGALRLLPYLARTAHLASELGVALRPGAPSAVA